MKNVGTLSAPIVMLMLQTCSTTLQNSNFNPEMLANTKNCFQSMLNQIENIIPLCSIVFSFKHLVSPLCIVCMTRVCNETFTDSEWMQYFVRINHSILLNVCSPFNRLYVIKRVYGTHLPFTCIFTIWMHLGFGTLEIWNQYNSSTPPAPTKVFSEWIWSITETENLRKLGFLSWSFYIHININTLKTCYSLL